MDKLKTLSKSTRRFFRLSRSDMVPDSGTIQSSNPQPILSAHLISQNPPPLQYDAVIRALDRIGRIFNDSKNRIDYRVIGGAALIAAGTTRTRTIDLDILVNDNDFANARQAICDYKSFYPTNANSVVYKSGVILYNVDIVIPSQIGISRFPAAEHSQHITIAVLASMETLLESKVSTFSDIYRRIKKCRKDVDDIISIIKFMSEHGMDIGLERIPGLNKHFVFSFVNEYLASHKYWKLIGCIVE
jgi:hypothetical protein